MLDLDVLRSRQEQRLLPALEAWNVAKKHLEEAIAQAEAREKEFRELSEDVKRRLDALALVTSMARELEAGPRVEQPSLPPATQPMLEAAPAPAAGPGIQLAEKTTTPMPIQNGAPSFQQFGGPLRRTWRPLFPSLRRSENA